jgi:hypothetical protein
LRRGSEGKGVVGVVRLGEEIGVEQLEGGGGVGIEGK